MPYKVIYRSQRVQRILQRIPEADARRIDAAIANLAADPRPAGARKLRGRPAYRIRAGDYRVIYLIDDADQVVTIDAILRRDEGTYRPAR